MVCEPFTRHDAEFNFRYDLQLICLKLLRFYTTYKGETSKMSKNNITYCKRPTFRLFIDKISQKQSGYNLRRHKNPFLQFAKKKKKNDIYSNALADCVCAKRVVSKRHIINTIWYTLKVIKTDERHGIYSKGAV